MKKKEERTAAAKYNGLPYLAAIMMTLFSPNKVTDCSMTA